MDGLGKEDWGTVSSRIDQCVEELPEEVRFPVMLRFLEGRTEREVADELGIDQHSVSDGLRRGLEQLREKLEDAGVAMSASTLSSLLDENAVVRPRPSLAKSLVKIGMAGVGGPLRRVGDEG